MLCQDFSFQQECRFQTASNASIFEAYNGFRLSMLHIHGTLCPGGAASYSGHFYESLYNVNPIKYSDATSI